MRKPYYSQESPPGDVPDVMSVYPAETAYHTMMDDGVYTDLSNEEWLHRASDKALQFSSWNGKYYAMPFALNSFGIYCNDAMFEEAGLEFPTTWDELMEVCEAFQANGITPFTFVDKDPGNLVQEAERLIGIVKTTSTKTVKKWEQAMHPSPVKISLISVKWLRRS